MKIKRKIYSCLRCHKNLVDYHPLARYCHECRGILFKEQDARYHVTLRLKKKAEKAAKKLEQSQSTKVE